MGHLRKLTLLFIAAILWTGFDDSNCRAQDANTSAFLPNQWGQGTPVQHFDQRGTTLHPTTNFFSIYHPTRIDSARRVAIHYRSQSSPGTPAVSELANTNASLVEQWADLADSINALDMRVGQANAKLAAARQDFDDVASKLQQYGLTPTIGMLLSHKKSQLEDWQVDGAAGHRVNDEIQRTREKQLANEMIAYDGSDAVRQATQILSLAGYRPMQPDFSALNSQVQSLLRERSEWLRSLNQGYNDYRQKLSELDSASTAFDNLTNEYRRLVHRNVTWIRSSNPLSVAEIRKVPAGLKSLFDSRRSEAFGYSLSQKWMSNPASGWTLVGTAVLIFLVRFLAKSWLLGIGKRKRMVETSASIRKCLASLLTPLVAFGLPTILYSVARWLGSGYVTESTLHVANALYAASFMALIIEVPRQLLRKHGFVDKHLKIELPGQQRASVYLLIIGAGLVLSAYVVTLAGQVDHGMWSGSIARLGYIASLFIVAWTVHMALKPNGGFIEPLIQTFGGSVLYRIRYLYYFVGVGFALSMITLLVFGYEFTVSEIIKRAGTMFVSILVGLTLWSAVKIVASGVWHILTGTRDERVADEDADIQPAVSGALAEHSLELKHQIAFLSQCTLVLAAIACVGWLWVDIFPNVQMGNPVLWTVQDTITQTFLDANGQKLSRSQAEATQVTALHLVMAAATLFVAFQLAKLLPGIFDALVLQRVNFDEAMEHLALVLGRCLLFGAGCFIACRLIGLRWETIQWLVVGLTIGLGFSMQDFVRNLLGGLVVFFEKPARLGDLITVGNFTGRVAAQKLRTTVLADEEGREVIIPNKNFVSHDVINWMGAGRLKAIPIEVAVTRDERPADICRMLQQLLVAQPDLLLSPAPQATLVCIGQQSQRIELRAWIEEHQDTARCRESLTKIVLDFLVEKNLLAPNQPRQPSLNEASNSQAIRGFPTRRKRTA